MVKTRRAVGISKTKVTGIESRKAEAKEITPIPNLTEVSSEEKRHLISEAAYFRAERRGFAPGYELEDWLLAETEIDRLLGNA